ncbi:hypothetical protein MRB53_006643 [Persea americana]|uniref:Uncharacterized protein n=1 Tax=Persea americana TaxID=3435 RepID=A0ACC2MGW1_PERAE|nr:hypothetical protein MRB53_006643 [Persea americana]
MFSHSRVVRSKDESRDGHHLAVSPIFLNSPAFKNPISDFRDSVKKSEIKEKFEDWKKGSWRGVLPVLGFSVSLVADLRRCANRRWNPDIAGEEVLPLRFASPNYKILAREVTKQSLVYVTGVVGRDQNGIIGALRVTGEKAPPALLPWKEKPLPHRAVSRLHPHHRPLE